MCAKILNIPVLNINYINDSIDEGKFLPFDSTHQLQKFSNLKIGILGFDEKDENAIDNLIIENGGIPIANIENIKKNID